MIWNAVVSNVSRSAAVRALTGLKRRIVGGLARRVAGRNPQSGQHQRGHHVNVAWTEGKSRITATMP